MRISDWSSDVCSSDLLVVEVVDLRHRRVGAGAEALDLDDREQPVGGHLAQADAELLLAGLGDAVRAAQPAGRGAANLDEVLADRLHVEHRIEGENGRAAGRGRWCHYV